MTSADRLPRCLLGALAITLAPIRASAFSTPAAGAEPPVPSAAIDMGSRSELALNVSTGAAGSVRVEVQDAGGIPFPGRALADSVEIIGDEIERVASWKSGADLSGLAGQCVKLRFAMKDADLYSLWFRLPAASVQGCPS